MQRIPLTDGYEALVDDADYDFLMQWTWHATAARGQIRATRRERGHRILMHRAIMNCADHLEVDHINGNPLDNQRDNLRLATHQQNMWNRQKHKIFTSRFKGVYWSKSRGKWCAAINIGNKVRLQLGRFEDEELAARTYDAAARKYHGTFARTNFTTEE